MLTKDDIKEIGLELSKVIEHNITPQFQGVNERLDKVESRLDGVENRLNGVESQMVTKTYLDDKLADLEGGTVARQRKEDQKVNLLIQILENKKVLEETDVKQLQEFQIFPTPTGKN